MHIGTGHVTNKCIPQNSGFGILSTACLEVHLTLRFESVGELLGANSRERIAVPEFQRGYEWGKKHLDAIWSDIFRFQKERANADEPDKYFWAHCYTQSAQE